MSINIRFALTDFFHPAVVPAGNAVFLFHILAAAKKPPVN
ncbi:hypothetical protein l13_17070 [Neisseria weaveri ATCC 51223]|nr:hypothetical protein l13_17070 [Neisseria weaveri ATCC 51223]